MILCLFFCGAEAQVQHADEDRVKAAYLYNFAKFVEWPTASFAGPDDPTIICSVGDDRLADILQQTVSGKQTKGRPVAARQVSSQEQFKSCHILLITFQDKERISQILRWVQSSTVLTVGQSSEFTHLGGMINLVRNDSTLELEINPRAAEAAGLKISSRLLAVSRVVALPRGGGNS
jgi:YfiR/HmsC-like